MGDEVWLHRSWCLMEVVSFTPLPFYAPVPNCVGGWVGATAGLDVAEEEKINFPLPRIRPQLLDLSARIRLITRTDLS
jgi:hypothetical protein